MFGWVTFLRPSMTHTSVPHARDCAPPQLLWIIAQVRIMKYKPCLMYTVKKYCFIRDVKASRPKFWPRPRFRNLWRWPRPRPRDPLASASSFWSRPRTLIFNFKEPGVLSFRNTSEPPSKKRRTALFGHYRAASQNPNASDEPSKQLFRYIILINSWQFWHNSWILCTLQTLFGLRITATSISAFVLCASQFCCSRESLLSEWTYHVFTPSTHVKCCAWMPVFF